MLTKAQMRLFTLMHLQAPARLKSIEGLLAAPDMEQCLVQEARADWGVSPEQQLRGQQRWTKRRA